MWQSLDVQVLLRWSLARIDLLFSFLLRPVSINQNRLLRCFCLLFELFCCFRDEYSMHSFVVSRHSILSIRHGVCFSVVFFSSPSLIPFFLAGALPSLSARVKDMVSSHGKAQERIVSELPMQNFLSRRHIHTRKSLLFCSLFGSNTKDDEETERYRRWTEKDLSIISSKSYFPALAASRHSHRG